MGKREENKKHYQKIILETAKELFTAQDYENTTMEQIALKAGIGLGTAYNYFKSKDELFILTMAENTANDIKSNVEDTIIEEGSASDIVAEALLKQIRKFNLVNKNIWKTALPIVFSSLKSNNKTFQKIMRADFKVMDTLSDLINQLKLKNKIPNGFDTVIAVNLIFGALFMHLTMYLYTDEVIFDDVCEKIKADISFIFNNNQQGELVCS